MISRPARRIAQTGVAGALVLGVAGTAMANKSVDVTVDGKTQSVNSFGGTVADVLAKSGVEVGPHDVVVPAPDTPISDGDQVVVKTARKLTVAIDGKKRTYWTTATSVGQAMSELGIRAEGAKLSASRSQSLGRDGLALSVATPKRVTVKLGDRKRKVTTTGRTVADALKAAKVKVDGDDIVKPGLKHKVKPGMAVRVVRVSSRTETRTQAIPHGVRTVSSSALYTGTSKVTTPGRDGARTTTLRFTLRDGKVVGTKVVGTRIARQPVTEVVAKGTKARPKPAPKAVTQQHAARHAAPKPATTAPKPASSSNTGGGGLNLANAAMWDRIAQCESTGNWSINTGNGYYGGLQFDIQTWLGAGGGQFAPRADLASRAQQITVANRVYASRGLGPWGCAHAA